MITNLIPVHQWSYSGGKLQGLQDFSFIGGDIVFTESDQGINRFPGIH